MTYDNEEVSDVILKDVFHHQIDLAAVDQHITTNAYQFKVFNEP